MYKKSKVFNYKENLYCFDNNLNTILKECLKIDYKGRIQLRYLKKLVDDYVKDIYSNNL